jgi:hypothetical protein
MTLSRRGDNRSVWGRCCSNLHSGFYGTPPCIAVDASVMVAVYTSLAVLLRGHPHPLSLFFPLLGPNLSNVYYKVAIYVS